MAWKLEIHFSDGSSELVDDDFETEQDAQDEYDSWLVVKIISMLISRTAIFGKNKRQYYSVLTYRIPAL